MSGTAESESAWVRLAFIFLFFYHALLSVYYSRPRAAVLSYRRPDLYVRRL